MTTIPIINEKLYTNPDGTVNFAVLRSEIMKQQILFDVEESQRRTQQRRARYKNVMMKLQSWFTQ